MRRLYERRALRLGRRVKVEEMVLGRGGPIEATLLPDLGGRLHRLRVLGHDLLRTPPDHGYHEREPFFWGAYVMAPWCNRLSTERIDFEGASIDLAPNFEDGSAIHGQVYVAPWRRIGEGSLAIEGSGAGWPWPYRVESTFEIDGFGLAVALRLTNLGDGPMPGGIGLHPWFAGSPIVAIDAGLVYESNLDPTAEARPVSGDTDMRRPRELSPGIDATWTELERPPVELRWPEIGLRATLDAAAATDIVATNSPLLGAIAVEPQTHAPQGLRRLIDGTRGAMSTLRPGDGLVLRIELTFADG